MLMPILTARTPAQAAHSVPVEASQPRERLQALVLSISGARADAILKILETLGRHLSGSEVLPKEALVKLMETLARILKFPPLPQETTHEFGQRLASFLEKLPPEARVVLEKQLGQRNLALQVRLLAEVLNNPAATDAGRLHTALQNPAINTSSLRAETGQQPRPPLPQPALPAQHLATLTAGSAPAMFGAPAEAVLLQAVLRKTFETGEEQAVAEPTIDGGEPEAEAAATPKRSAEATAKTPPLSQASQAAAGRPATAGEAMPLLRAAAAFLAADPEALSLVSAIAQGEIDPDLEMVFAPQLDEEMLSAGADAIFEGEVETAPASEMETEAPVADAEQPETVARDDKLLTRMSAAGDPPAVKTVATQEGAPIAEPVQAALEEDPIAADEEPAENPIALASDEKQRPERQPDKPVRILAETLKALIQNTLPLPESDIWEATTTPYKSPSDAAARVASLQPGDAPGLEAMLDAATVESGAGWTAELSDEIDSWVAQVDAGQDEASEARPAWAPLPKPDEAIRDPLLQHRLIEAMAGRDAIPFAIIPYLPAKTEDSLLAEPADEEQQAPADEDEAGAQARDEDQPDPRNREQAAPLPDTEPGDDDTTADAYALYLRMGGLG